MTSEERRRRRFSEEFRREQVKFIESGQLSIKEACKLFEVKRESVLLWIKRFGTTKPPERILISNGSEYERVKRLESEVKKLKEIIGQQQIELIANAELIRLAEEKLGEDFKKK